jgi:methyl-accepting chemotaxis protein
MDTGVLRTVAIARSSDISLGPYFAEDAKVTKTVAGALQEEIEALISGPEETELRFG